MTDGKRVPPHDLAAEEALLGAAMLDPEVAARLPAMAGPDDFYKTAHQWVASAIADLVGDGDAADPVTVRARLDRDGLLDQVGGDAAMVTLTALATRGASASGAAGYAGIVRAKRELRRLIEIGGDLADAGFTGKTARVHRLLEDALARTNGHAAGPSAPELDPDLDEFLDSDEPAYDWLIEGLIERNDRVIVTGPEGGGKSTLLRQIAVQAASGIHPFTLGPIDPLQVLLVDTENSQRQARRALTGLRATADGAYQSGRLRVRVLGHAIDLAATTVYSDLAARIEAQQVDLLVIGPLYKLIADDPIKEMPARAVSDAIDRLRAVRGSAVLIEAHSPYAEGARAKRPIRPYGASLWSRWPEFGLYLDPDGGALRHWRGQRDERSWPAGLQRSTPWPWAPQEGPDPADEWHGPTECADAIVALLLEAGVELSCNKITTELRARGRSFRNETIRDAAGIAHQRGDLARRDGPRGAWLYSAAEPPKADDVLDF